jgi:hypothetical protein
MISNQKVVNCKVVDLFVYNFDIKFVLIWLYLKNEFYGAAPIFRDGSRSNHL